MCILYIYRMLNVTIYVYALENHELEKVLNITYNSFTISVVLPFNKNSSLYLFNIYNLFI